MADEIPTTTPATASQKFRHIAKAIVLSGWVVCLLAAVLIVVSSLYMMVFHPEIPQPPTLREWSSIVLGFLFGNMMTMIKDFVEKNE